MKKLISFFLTIIIICSVFMVFRTTANAATSEDFEYSINSDGVSITITDYTGSSADVTFPSMLDGMSVTAVKGCQDLHSIQTVSFEDGILELGALLFVNSDNLTNINIPSSVIKIGNGLGAGCSKLLSINVGQANSYFLSDNGVLFNKAKTILFVYPPARQGEYTIPTSVEMLDHHSFSGANNLSEIFIHENILSIGTGALENCENVAAFHVDINNSNYSSEDGVLFNKNKTLLIQYPIGKYGEYTIPATVTEIESGAFEACSNLTVLNISSGVTKLNQAAFYNCTGIQSIYLPDGISEIPMWAFCGCTDLKSIRLPSDLDKILNVAFAGCALTSIDIPDSVTFIGGGAFQYCENLTEVTFPDGVQSLESGVFQYSGITTFTVPEGINSISSSAFENCKQLMSISIPESVQSIEIFAFRECDKLDNVSLPSNLHTIETGAFRDCSSLSNISLPNQITVIEYQTFWNCSNLETITILGEVERIERLAFSGCKSLSGVQLPDTVIEIGESAFANCSTLVNINIPDGLKSIGEFAFYGCYQMEGLDIPDSIESIGTRAFFNCSSITHVSIPNAITEIETCLFTQCYSLKSVDLHDDITRIGQDAFFNCTSLEGLVLPSSIEIIETGAFYNCDGLNSITFPSGIASIGDRAFVDSNSIQSAYFEGDAPTLGLDVFSEHPENFPIYYNCASSGFTNPWYGHPTEEYDIKSLIVSPVYYIDGSNGLLKDVPKDTTVTEFKANLLNSSDDIKLYVDGSEYTGDTVSSRMVVKLITEGIVKDELSIRIIGEVIDVVLDKETITMGTGELDILSETVLPGDAYDKSVSWTSSNESVATVVDGVVKGISEGECVITVTTHDGRFTDTCTVTVKSLGIESAVYTCGADGTIKGIKIETTTAQLVANLANDSADIKICDLNGIEVTGGVLCTGMTVKLIIDGIVRDELTIIILGDVNGDGKISITDYTLVRLDILGLKSLAGVFNKAGDINEDGKISITDYTLIRLDILGLKNIH